MHRTIREKRWIKPVWLSFVLLFLLFVQGCSTEFNLATRQEESLMYTTEREVAIGEKIAQQIEKQYDVITDVDVNERVEALLDRIVAVCDRKDILYFIKVLDDDMVNAVSLPGGYIYIFKGLLDKVETDDQLAGVIAHEVGHITARHGVKRAQASYAALLLQVAAMEAGGDVAGGVSLALSTIFTEYSQADEFQSDNLAVKYMKKAGFDPMGVKEFLVKLNEEQEKKIRPFSYWKTHPHISERISNANREITGKMEFRDYLNLMDK